MGPAGEFCGGGDSLHGRPAPASSERTTTEHKSLNIDREQDKGPLSAAADARILNLGDRFALRGRSGWKCPVIDSRPDIRRGPLLHKGGQITQIMVGFAMPGTMPKRYRQGRQRKLVATPPRHGG